MEKEIKDMDVQELQNELQNVKEELIIQRRRLKYGDKYEQASAKRKMGILKSKNELLEKEYCKKYKRENRNYKINQRIYAVTGRTKEQIVEDTYDYYGVKPGELIKKTVKGVAILCGIGVTLYGTLWTLYQLHNKGIDSAGDLIDAIEQYNKNDSKTEYIVSNGYTKMDDFLATKEGKMVEKYSLIYGVDKNLAANTYLYSDGVKIGEYVSAYNMQKNQYDDVIVSSNNIEDQIKAVCAKLADASQLCNGNPVMMINIFENGYDNLDQVDIKNYKNTLNKNMTKLSTKILNNCPDIIENKWYEDGKVYTRTITRSITKENISEHIIDSVVAHNVR